MSARAFVTVTGQLPNGTERTFQGEGSNRTIRFDPAYFRIQRNADHILVTAAPALLSLEARVAALETQVADVCSLVDRLFNEVNQEEFHLKNPNGDVLMVLGRQGANPALRFYGVSLPVDQPEVSLSAPDQGVEVRGALVSIGLVRTVP